MFILPMLGGQAMKGSLICFCLLLSVAIIAESKVARPTGCGFVHDGSSDRFDVDVQSSTTAISTNWFGFESSPSDAVLEYEVCLISQSKATPEMLSSVAKERCSNQQRFEGLPDVYDWVKVGRSNSCSFDNLELIPFNRYFAVVKATFASGLVMYSNSDGVVISPGQETPLYVTIQELQASAQELEKATSPDFGTNSVTTNTTPDAAVRELRIVEQQPALTCSIDIDNACRKGRIGVGAFLTELYGPPVWNLEDKNRDVLISLPSRSSESGLSEGDRAGIAVGVAIFVLLFLLIAALLIFFKGRKKENKFQTVLYRDENLELEDGTEYKQGRQTEKDSVSSQSKVIFPEMKIRRLSQGDARPIYEEEAPAEPGKRQHPALEVQSSSLRDYRQQ